MKAALAKIAELRERAAKAKVGGNIQYNPGWHLALDLKNMLDISEAVTRAALERTESRGAHTREDFPDTRQGMGQGERDRAAESRTAFSVVREPLPEPPAELAGSDARRAMRLRMTDF